MQRQTRILLAAFVPGLACGVTGVNAQSGACCMPDASCMMLDGALFEAHDCLLASHPSVFSHNRKGRRRYVSSTCWARFRMANFAGLGR